MKSRWKWCEDLAPGERYVVFASLIPPRSRSSTWKLFMGARAVRKQLEHVDGVVGYALLARPARRQYATLSIWRDDAALDSFAGSSSHRELQRDLASEMSQTGFVRWTIASEEGRPSWNEALDRLGPDRGDRS